MLRNVSINDRTDLQFIIECINSFNSQKLKNLYFMGMEELPNRKGQEIYMKKRLSVKSLIMYAPALRKRAVEKNIYILVLT